MRKLGSSLCEKEAKIFKMLQKMLIIRKDAKRNEANKAKIFVYLFRKLKRKSCETGYVSHSFGMVAKKKFKRKRDTLF
jgi:hypothetical protein